ncbi:hypothetical protein [Novosphingobium terrae]|uniref:hypothetical protein n=1 Tax=Novosphingobium terrae TaxID=2726189 RepID=UPI001F13D9DE|nr:hypothetical protein [Novosphingobium terrae]
MHAKLAARLAALSLAPLLASVLSAPAQAQGPDRAPPPLPAGVTRSYVPLANGAPGVLYEPTQPGPKAQIAFYLMHASGDYLTFSACYELSKRGYRVLCANNTTSKSGAFDDGVLDDAISQAAKGVSYLQHLQGVSKVLLFGHSGGATIITGYQAIAEGGVAWCQRAELIHRCPDSMAGYKPADGVVLADSNWGQAAMVLLSIDPAVTDESSGRHLDPSLDSYNPANGFKDGAATYSADFIKRFQAGVAARNARLLAHAQERLALIEAGKGDYTGDELLQIPGAFVAANKLFSTDPRLLNHSVKPWPLVHKDGSVTTQIIHSVRLASAGPMGPMTSDSYRASLKTTVKNYLGSFAIRTTPDFGYGEDSTIRGVDWHSTYAAPPGNVEVFSKPLLTLGMTGNWEGLAAETIYNHAASKDKSIAFIEGATHVYTPCTACEKTPGQFGDTMKTTYDYIDKWVSQPGRFLTGN